jgi:hypothetical protein
MVGMSWWICWMIAVVSGDAVTFGEEAWPSPFTYRRVMVPEKDLPLLGPDFVPVPMEELLQLLAASVSAGQAEGTAGAPRLERAMYVAGLSGQDLVSAASLFRVSGEGQALLPLQPCSLALRPATLEEGSEEGAAQALDELATSVLRCDMEGRPGLVVDGPEDVWLGWSCRGQPATRPQGLDFAFQYPACPENRLWLQLPAAWEVVQASTVFRRVESLPAEVEAAWNRSPLSAEGNAGWWCLELSGATRVSFSVMPTNVELPWPYPTLVERERVNYTVRGGALEINTTLDLGNSQPRLGPWRLHGIQGVQLSSITFAEAPVAWRPGPTPDTLDIFVEDQPPSEQSLPLRRRLEIRGLARWPEPFASQTLPRLFLANSFTLNGLGRVIVHEPWITDFIRLDDSQPLVSETSKAPGVKRWRYGWIGQSPNLSLRTAKQRQEGKVVVLSRFTNRDDGLEAYSWLEMAPTDRLQSACRLRLNPGWGLESIQVSDRRSKVQSIALPEEGADVYELQFNPPLPANLASTIEIQTRYAWSAGGDPKTAQTLRFRGRTPLLLEAWETQEFCWIEAAGRYKLEPTTELVAGRLEAAVIPESQRNRLPRVRESWIVQPDLGVLPELTFIRQSSPYSTQLETRVSPEGRRVGLTYRLRCTPLAGSVTSMLLDTAAVIDQAIRWRQLVDDGDGSTEWLPIDSRRLPSRESTASKPVSDGRASWRLDLRKPMAETFVIEGWLELPWGATADAAADQVMVPLLSLPEAAQQDASLLLDGQLTILGWSEDTPLTPAGEWIDQQTSRGWQYRYEPTQVSKIAIGPLAAPHLPPAWFSGAVSRLLVFSQGGMALRFTADLHPAAHDRLHIELPTAWTIRQAQAAGQELTVTANPSSAGAWELHLPQGLTTAAVLPIEITMDGPRPELHHRQPLPWPGWRTGSPLVDHRYQLWLPEGMAVDAGSAIALKATAASWAIDRWLPSRWWASLWHDQSAASLSSVTLDDSMPSRDSWSASLHLAWESTEPTSQPLKLVMSDAGRAEKWLVVFCAFAVGLCLSVWRSELLPAGWLMMLGVLGMANPEWVAWVQAAAVGWLFACLIKMFDACFYVLRPGSDLSQGQAIGPSLIGLMTRREVGLAPTQAATRSVSILWMLLLAWAGWWTQGRADQASSSAASFSAAPQDRWFYLVVPVDEDGQASSRVAYVPQGMLQQLYGAREVPARGNQVITARYDLSLPASPPKAVAPPADLRLRFVVDIQDLSRPLVIPLRADQGTIVSMRVDGSEMPLGSRWKWNDGELQWNPFKLGVTAIEMRIQPTIRRDLSGRDRMQWDILPVPQSVVMAEFESAMEVESNAIGRFTTLGSGRYLIQPGPQTRLEISWRPVDRESRLVPLEGSLHTELAMISRQLIAKTRVELDELPMGGERLELECDAAWQPLGNTWGAALVTESSEAGSNGRRRYRLRWQPAMNSDASAPRRLEMYWTISEPRSSLVNLPWIEIPMVQWDEVTVDSLCTEDARWKLEGMDSWVVADSMADFGWVPERGATRLSYRRTTREGAPYLRRSTEPASTLIQADTSLLFEANHLLSSTHFRLENPFPAGSTVDFQLPDGHRDVRVRVNDTDVPFTISLVEGQAPRLQVFPQPDRSIKSVTVELTQPYDPEEWADLPIPRLLGHDLRQQQVLVYRSLEENIAWRNLNSPAVERLDSLPRSIIGLDQSKLDRQVLAWGAILRRPSAAEAPSSAATGETTAVPYPGRWSWPQYLHQPDNTPRRGLAVATMRRNFAQWEYQVQGRIEAAAHPIDGVLLEIPEGLLASLECSHRFTVYGQSESGRQLIYVFSDLREAEQAFDFEILFPLSTTDNDSATAVPDVRWMGRIEWQSWIILPREIDGQDARWSWSGARVVERPEVPKLRGQEVVRELKEQLVLEPTASRPRIRLSNLSSSRLAITLSLAEHTFLKAGIDGEQVSSAFWFIPRGHKTVEVLFPEGWELLVAECDGRTVASQRLESVTKPIGGNLQQVSITLQSATLPQCVKVYFRVTEATTDQLVAAASWPVLAEAIPEQCLVYGWPKPRAPFGLEPRVPASAAAEAARALLNICEQTTGLIAEVPLRERSQWWENWQAATRQVWFRAVASADPEHLAALGESRQLFCDRFQLPTLLGDAWRLSKMAFDGGGSSSTWTVHELVYRADEAVAKPRQSFLERSRDWLGASRWLLLGQAIFGVLGVILAGGSWRLLSRWKPACVRFAQLHPWWLWVTFGTSLWLFLPSSWLPVVILLIASSLSLRSYWLYHHLKPAALK